MNKTKKKSKALKRTGNNAGFFRALFLGLAVCVAVWLVISLVFAFIMSKQVDSNAFGGILSVAISVISLVAGGASAAKMDKSRAVISSFTLGTVVLAVGYLACAIFDLSKGLGAVMKTVTIAITLLSPMVGAKLVTGKKRVTRRTIKRNM